MKSATHCVYTNDNDYTQKIEKSDTTLLIKRIKMAAKNNSEFVCKIS